MICPIIQYPDELLRKVHLEFDSRAHGHIVQDMFDTLDDADGLGLSAIQIGYPVKLFVLNPRYFMYYQNAWKQKLVFPNPVLLSQEGKQSTFEGCLSIPNVTVEMERPTDIWMHFGDHAPNRRGAKVRISGRDCAVFCHEIEHTQGRLIVDYEWEL